MNPGYHAEENLIDPPLTGMPNLALADFIVKEKLFNMFLYWGCIALTPDHAVMNKIATQNPWPRPISVYGYDDTCRYLVVTSGKPKQRARMPKTWAKLPLQA
jgi:hypothetical protein